MSGTYIGITERITYFAFLVYYRQVVQKCTLFLSAYDWHLVRHLRPNALEYVPTSPLAISWA